MRLRVNSMLSALALFFVAASSLCSNAQHAQSGQTGKTSLYNRGVRLFNQDRLDAARTVFLKLLAKNPHDLSTLSYLGLIALRQTRYADAVSPLEQIVQAKPNLVSSHINLGNAYQGLKRYSDAEHQFELALHIQPNSVSAGYDLASVYFQTKQYHKAVAQYRKVAAQSPKDPDIQNNLGVALQAAGNLTGAERAYAKAAALAPRNSSYQINLALALQQLALKKKSLGQTRQYMAYQKNSLTALHQAVEYAPSDYRISEIYAEALENSGAFSMALAQYQHTHALEPTLFEPVYRTALLQARMGQMQTASSTIQNALLIRPTDINALQLAGYLQYSLHRYSQAVKTYDKLITLAPDNTAAWINLGAALQENGDLATVLSVLQAAKQHDIKGASIASLYLAAATLYLNKGDNASLKLALDNLQNAIVQSPNNASAYNTIGLVQKKLGMLNAALTSFLRATALSPRNSDFYNNLGVVYEARGDYHLARVAYKKALALNKGNQQAAINIKKLGNLH